MRSVLAYCLSALLLLGWAGCSQKASPRVLVFSKTNGWHHASIGDGQQAIWKLGAENGFSVDTTSDAKYFTDDSLKHYNAVVFLNTTGDVLDQYQENAFERYIQAGGGFVGVHAAADTEYDWGWYGDLVGGYFLDHPGINDTFPNVQQAILTVKDKNHPATAKLPSPWQRTDEYYSFKKLNKNTTVLITVDENSYHGGKNGTNHPLSWFHEFDGGRAFYTNLGHTNESYKEPMYLQHLLGGIQYAMGDGKPLDYGKAHTMNVPDEDRFTKTQLVRGQFYEPTEMTILPNLDVLVAQRRGEIMLVKHGDSIARQAGFLEAYFKSNAPNVNAEEGVLGIKADPDFAKNHYVYIFYSPADTSVNRLSRFTMEGDSLNMATERTVLEFYSQRDICCHTGGSIAFDKDGLLYVSTGDNSTPFDEPGQPYVNHGYAPLDDRPGHQQYDARRSSGNANDLRGKILRIRINPNATYSIPDGNLYPKNKPGTRGEIYVQGNRNPYRISVDQKNGYLYWGEVGPDAGEDSLSTRGPRGYDELNQARTAGNFGWPYFVGNNYAYHQYDYATGQSGPAFTANKVINASRNNTGIKDLSAAQPAFIWYPYGPSPDFPSVRTGGRNAMAGPVYYTDMFPAATRLPDYFNGKLFFYDWIRNWVKVVTMKENGDYYKMEPFMEHTKLNGVIDMEVGSDGRIYMLEYGTGWFTKNADAGLSRIDYNGGNRAPKAGAVTLDKTSGALPLAVTATVEARDPEGEALSFDWDMGDGTKLQTKEPKVDHVYKKGGDYVVNVTVTDAAKLSSKATPADVVAGNTAPQVNISVSGNKTFYFPGVPVQYGVGLLDAEEPALKNSGSPAEGLFVSAEYQQGLDKAGAQLGHQQVSGLMMGKGLVSSLDCKSCHKQDEKSIGPSYAAVAAKYKGKADASEYLANKIIKGGSGVWGEVAMAAHPNLKTDDAMLIVSWIRSLSGGPTQKSLPASGSVSPNPAKAADGSALVLTASYTDKGGANVKSLSSTAVAVLVSPVVKVDWTFLSSGNKELGSFDLTGILSATPVFSWKGSLEKGYEISLHLDAPDGKVLGSAVLKGTDKSPRIALSPVTDGREHQVFLVVKDLDEAEKAEVKWEAIRFGVK
ncbi:ThuA domain-containing protein [Flavihumibacter petaseus]|uniref:Putative oxidoreductase n=1 Tax=Flavihumibacter petaseus NBRC 106054 TaxID=1220578 RepID=A0A0E9MX13_9BACT|nr:ThuA domain-containing protein [Flavihumibacter petaseus]GAO42043.1 putative oxidoreductase [Flavihumibacter petaseus NBRC 106054]